VETTEGPVDDAEVVPVPKPVDVFVTEPVDVVPVAEPDVTPVDDSVEVDVIDVPELVVDVVVGDVGNVAHGR
jgi:hypothetical protein